MKQRLFLSHVEKFMQKHQLFPASGHGWVSVSGGMDSICLLQILLEIKKRNLSRLKKLSVLHFNHGTREACESEEKLVRSFCEKKGLELKVICNRNLTLNVNNFEQVARNWRRKEMRKIMNLGDVIYQGHHIDDSYEWWLLQSMKSGEKVFGIPHTNGFLRRPFLCVTKKQIRLYSDSVQLNYLEDESNSNLRFERNYLREKIVKPIEQRFPKYLKHYVRQMQRQLEKKNDEHRYFWRQDKWGSEHLLFHEQRKPLRPTEQEILKVLKRLSTAKRGQWQEQVSRCLSLLKQKEAGRLTFSGGVSCFKGMGSLSFENEQARKKRLSCERKIDDKKIVAQIPGPCDFQQFQSRLEKLIAAGAAGPWWVVSTEKKQMDKMLPGRKTIDHWSPELSQRFLDQGLWFRPGIELLVKWEKAEKKHSHHLRVLIIEELLLA